ncbi:unnamed protein product [Anisakis simplex]|uniref:Calcineurin B homologous protein 3 (inferred by orthology to a human protein) n=1 Tax=Anisakis simplex TaxID=6269 RepID=A0A0M3J0N0_ANISI|nr:unnamed protein product [Anisakis simplex]
MGNCRSVMSHPQLISDEEVDQLAKSTGFTHKQILRLHLRFMALDKGGKGVLDRDDFFNIPDLEMNPLGDRIIDAFFAEASDPEKRLTFPEFVAVLAHFRPCSEHAYTHEHSANDHHTHDALTNNSREEKLKCTHSAIMSTSHFFRRI